MTRGAGNADGRADAVDWLVVTAANAAQARGYRAQLAARAGRLDGVRRWMVVADSGGKRIGSGASTILVLWKLAEKLAKARPRERDIASVFRSKRIIVLHSGGDSRRLPAYAAQGKIFAPIPDPRLVAARRRGAGARETGVDRELFDAVLEDIRGLRTPAEGRVVVAAGDLLLNASASDPDLSAPGVVGVASLEGLARASRHGVFVLDSASGSSVERFLQKPSGERMRDAGAIVQGRAWVDTGVVSLDPGSVAGLLGAAGVEFRRGRLVAASDLAAAVRRGTCPQIDLYVHVLAALPAATTRDNYLAELASVFGPLGPAERSAAARLYSGLRGTRFTAARLSACAFLHVGSTREMLTVHGVRGKGTLVDGCERGATWDLAGDNLVAGVPATRARVRLARGLGLVALPIGARDWAVIAFGDRDDCKTPLERGGTALNRPLAGIAGLAGVWRQGVSRTFWEARLWTIGPIGTSLRAAQDVIDGVAPTGRAASMAEIMPRVNHARLIAARSAWRGDRLSRDVVGAMDADPDLGAAEIAATIRTGADARRLSRSIARALKPPLATLRDARLLRAAAVLGDRSPGSVVAVQRRVGGDLNDAACDAVARAVLADHALADQPGRARAGREARAECAVRVDLAGGWSDTPPVCHERGGAVVNASILLNGARPLRAAARIIDRPVIVLRSLDAGAWVELRTSPEVFDHRRDGDWSALAKAACVVSGVAPPSREIVLRGWLERFGGGVELEFASAVPRGSGLGTSSALGATILAALEGVCGKTGPVRDMLGRAMLLEQLMGTGGGWQDQSGAALGGARVLRTRPGRDQHPRAERLPLEFGPGSVLEGRVLLYYTGMQRLAKGILRQIVLRYLARDRHTLGIVERLKAGAERAAAALRAGDTESFCRAVNEYWWLKRSIDPGASNAKIEAIEARVRGLLSACVMPGAGGGGFLFMIARDPDAAALVRKRLETDRPNRRAGFYDIAVDSVGLRVG